MLGIFPRIRSLALMVAPCQRRIICPVSIAMTLRGCGLPRLESLTLSNPSRLYTSPNSPHQLSLLRNLPASIRTMRWIEYCECKQPWRVDSAKRIRHYLYNRMPNDAAQWAVEVTDQFFQKGTTVQPEYEQSSIVTTTMKRKRKK